MTVVCCRENTSCFKRKRTTSCSEPEDLESSQNSNKHSSNLQFACCIKSNCFTDFKVLDYLISIDSLRLILKSSDTFTSCGANKQVLSRCLLKRARRKTTLRRTISSRMQKLQRQEQPLISLMKKETLL